jgi:hypothetical protein
MCEVERHAHCGHLRYMREVQSDGWTIFLPYTSLSESYVADKMRVSGVRAPLKRKTCRALLSYATIPHVCRRNGEGCHTPERARLRQRFPAEKSIFRAVYSLYGINDGTEMSKIINTSWTPSTLSSLDRIFVTCYFIYVLITSAISVNTETDWLQDGRLEFLFLTGRSFFFTVTSITAPAPAAGPVRYRWAFSCCRTTRADH